MYRRIFPQLLLVATAFSFSQRAFGQERLPDLVRRLKPSVVAIITYTEEGEPLTTGSGFFVRPGQVVTSLHVVRGAYRAEIKLLEGKGRTYPVSGTLAIDEEGDLALLGVETFEHTRSTDLANTLPEEGESIFVIGNPLKLEGSVADGIVSALREVPNLGWIVQITAPISHGNSGSPVFNLRGEVVGVVTVKVTNGQNINLAIGSGRLTSLKPTKLQALSQVRINDRSNMVDSLYRRGLDSLWLGNYDNALVYFENAVNKDPKRADAWVQVGYCKLKQGKNGEAIKAYKQALHLNPEFDDINNKIGDAYYYAGRLTEAIEYYKAAAKSIPDQGQAYYNLAVVYFETGDEQMALTQARILQTIDERLYEKFLRETQ